MPTKCGKCGASMTFEDASDGGCSQCAKRCARCGRTDRIGAHFSRGEIDLDYCHRDEGPTCYMLSMHEGWPEAQAAERRGE